MSALWSIIYKKSANQMASGNDIICVSIWNPVTSHTPTGRAKIVMAWTLLQLSCTTWKATSRLSEGSSFYKKSWSACTVKKTSSSPPIHYTHFLPVNEFSKRVYYSRSYSQKSIVFLVTVSAAETCWLDDKVGGTVDTLAPKEIFHSTLQMMKLIRGRTITIKHRPITKFSKSYDR